MVIDTVKIRITFRNYQRDYIACNYCKGGNYNFSYCWTAKSAGYKEYKY